MTINIPLNKKGVYEFEYYLDYKEAKNIKVVEFSREDYYYLQKFDYLDFINVNCDALIDLYEEEIILYDKLYKAVKITEILIRHINEERFTKLANILLDCYKLAIKSKTFIEVNCYGCPCTYKAKSNEERKN